MRRLTIETLEPRLLNSASPSRLHGYQTFYATAATDHVAPSGEAYYRFDWSQIESRPGVYNFSAIDAAVATAKAAGQGFNFRIMPYEVGNSGPLGLRSAGLPGTTFVFAGRMTFQPDLNNPRVQADLDNLMAALGRRYQHDLISTVDVGWWGAWGEWNDYGTSRPLVRPTTATTEWLINETHKDFPHSFAIVQASLATDDPAAFKYAMKTDCGVRFDGWGDWSTHGQWSNQNNEYPAAIAAMGNEWKRAPIILEPWGTFSTWLNEPWQKSFQWAEHVAHAWMFSNKGSSLIPDAMQASVEQLIASLSG